MRDTLSVCLSLCQRETKREIKKKREVEILTERDTQKEKWSRGGDAIHIKHFRFIRVALIKPLN